MDGFLKFFRGTLFSGKVEVIDFPLPDAERRAETLFFGNGKIPDLQGDLDCPDRLSFCGDCHRPGIIPGGGIRRNFEACPDGAYLHRLQRERSKRIERIGIVADSVAVGIADRIGNGISFPVEFPDGSGQHLAFGIAELRRPDCNVPDRVFTGKKHQLEIFPLVARGGQLNAAALFRIRPGVKNPFHGVDDINTEPLYLRLFRGNFLRRLRIDGEEPIAVAEQRFSVFAKHPERQPGAIPGKIAAEFAVAFRDIDRLAVFKCQENRTALFGGQRHAVPVKTFKPYRSDGFRIQAKLREVVRFQKLSAHMAETAEFRGPPIRANRSVSAERAVYVELITVFGIEELFKERLRRNAAFDRPVVPVDFGLVFDPAGVSPVAAAVFGIDEVEGVSSGRINQPVNHVEFAGSHEEEFQTVIIRQLGTDSRYIGVPAYRGDIDEILVPFHVKFGLFIGKTAVIGELQTGKDGGIVPFRRSHYAVNHRHFAGGGNLKKVSRR